MQIQNAVFKFKQADLFTFLAPFYYPVRHPVDTLGKMVLWPAVMVRHFYDGRKALKGTGLKRVYATGSAMFRSTVIGSIPAALLGTVWGLARPNDFVSTAMDKAVEVNYALPKTALYDLPLLAWNLIPENGKRALTSVPEIPPATKRQWHSAYNNSRVQELNNRVQELNDSDAIKNLKIIASNIPDYLPNGETISKYAWWGTSKGAAAEAFVYSSIFSMVLDPLLHRQDASLTSPTTRKYADLSLPYRLVSTEQNFVGKSPKNDKALG